jgi:hypothetical protein
MSNSFPERRTEMIVQAGVLSEEAFAWLGAEENLVYVRKRKAQELIASLTPEQARDCDLEPEAMIYVVHKVNGDRLAIFTDHDSAFAAAIAHDYAPVSVH